MDIIDQKSGVKFSPEDRSALLHQAIEGKELWAKKPSIVVLPDNRAFSESFKQLLEDQNKAATPPK
jgi:hypothetical protein